MEAPLTVSTGSILSQAMGRLEVSTRGGDFVDLTQRICGWLTEAKAGDGLLTLFLRHTSAGLVIQENADPDVQLDLGTALDRLAPEDARWQHDSEGPDDMPAHVKAMLTGVNLSIPVLGGRPALGTWQAVYLAEHRAHPHRREVVLHYLGTRA